jgi:hypothetical protein
MDEEKKKKILVAVIVVCLGGAAAISIFSTMGGGGGGGAGNEPLVLLCYECRGDFEMDREDYQQAMADKGPGAMMPMPGMGPMPVNCELCGEEAAYIAEKCKECGTVFIRDPRLEYPDECPECGYSAIKERVENR